jgi:hypothetical protein
MAIYKGREVQIIGEVNKGFTSVDTFQVQLKDGSLETVKISEVQFTEAEKKDLQKRQDDKFENVSVISEKDLKEIRDSQDEEKIKAAQDKQDQPKDVTIKASSANITESNPTVKSDKI